MSIEPAMISTEEQARRRLAMRRALAHVRMEGLEPDPIVFEYIERYARGELTIDEAIATLLRRYTAKA